MRRVSSSGPGNCFVGRRPEIGLFSDMLSDVSEGRLGILLVSGDPGIGKTRFVEESIRSVDCSATAHWGYWREGARRTELSVWQQILRSVLRSAGPDELGSGLESVLAELSVVIPELRDERPELPQPSTGETQLARLFDVIQRLLRKSAAICPRILVLDNLHLSGLGSLDLLQRIADEQRDSAVLIVATFRALPLYHREPFSSVLSELRAHSHTREIRLGPLAPDETSLLFEEILGLEPPARLLGEVQHRTGGNPLFVTEAARLVRDRSVLVDDALANVWDHALPAAVNGTISHRFNLLPASSKLVLEIASIVGETFTEEDIALAGSEEESLNFPHGKSEQAGQAPDQLLRGLQDGIDFGFIDKLDEVGEYRFTHSVIHSAIRAHVPLQRRRQYLLRLATATETVYHDRLGPRAFRLAEWWGALPGRDAEQNRRRYLLLAADAAVASRAWGEAIELFEELAADSENEIRSAEDARAMTGLGRSYHAIGRSAQGIACYRRAFDYFRHTDNVDEMIRIATTPYYPRVGEPGHHDFCEETLSFVPADSPIRGLLLYSQGIGLLGSLGDFSRAERSLAEGLRIGVSQRDPQVQARNLAALGFLDCVNGRPEDGLDKLKQVYRILDTHPDPQLENQAGYAIGTALLALGRYDEAELYAERMLAAAQMTAESGIVASACHVRTRTELLRGDWSSACRYIDQGLAADPDHLMLIALRCFLEYTRGDLELGDRFRERILSMRRRVPSGPWHVHIHAASTAAVRARNSGDTSGLAGHLPQLRSIAAAFPAHPFIRLRAHLLIGFIAAQLDDRDQARQSRDSIMKLPPLLLIRPYLRERFLGLMAHCGADHAGARTHFEEGLRQVRLYGDRPIEAWLLCELGEALLPEPHVNADGRLNHARRLILDARGTAESLGMSPLATRANALLESISQLVRDGRPAHTHLTERERQILRRVATGMTNQAIAAELSISTWTVVNHMRSVLSKLGASNRTEAVSVARRLGSLED